VGGEVKVYSAILQIGISTINAIHEKTGLERRGVYDIINKLIEKGLVSYTLEKGKRTYRCTNPNKLLTDVKNKQEKLREIEKKVPEIRSMYEYSKPKIAAEVFRGKEGIKSIWEDMLNYKENYFIGGGWYIVDKFPNYWPQYNKRRIKAGTKWYNLVRHDFRKRKIPDVKLMNVRFLPEDFSGSPSVIFIYGNKVVNVLWGDELFAFVIESREIAENYKKYHKYLWDRVAKK